MRAAIAAQRVRPANIETDAKKYRPGTDPLEKEEVNPLIQPHGATEQKQMLKMVKRLLAKTRNQSERNALNMWRANLKAGTIEGLVRQEWLRDFWAWMLGRGREEDHKKTPWYRQSLADDNEVSAYIDSFVIKMHEFRVKLALLGMRRPVGINQTYLFYKYVVRGEPPNKANFLQDWQLFSDEFYKGKDAGNEWMDKDEFVHPHEVAPYGPARKIIANQVEKFHDENDPQMPDDDDSDDDGNRASMDESSDDKPDPKKPVPDMRKKDFPDTAAQAQAFADAMDKIMAKYLTPEMKEADAKAAAQLARSEAERARAEAEAAAKAKQASTEFERIQREKEEIARMAEEKQRLTSEKNALRQQKITEQKQQAASNPTPENVKQATEDSKATLENNLKNLNEQVVNLGEAAKRAKDELDGLGNIKMEIDEEDPASVQAAAEKELRDFQAKVQAELLDAQNKVMQGVLENAALRQQIQQLLANATKPSPPNVPPIHLPAGPYVRITSATKDMEEITRRVDKFVPPTSPTSEPPPPQPPAVFLLPPKEKEEAYEEPTGPKAPVAPVAEKFPPEEPSPRKEERGEKRMPEGGRPATGKSEPKALNVSEEEETPKPPYVPPNPIKSLAKEVADAVAKTRRKERRLGKTKATLDDNANRTSANRKKYANLTDMFNTLDAMKNSVQQPGTIEEPVPEEQKVPEKEKIPQPGAMEEEPVPLPEPEQTETNISDEAKKELESLLEEGKIKTSKKRDRVSMELEKDTPELEELLKIVEQQAKDMGIEWDQQMKALNKQKRTLQIDTERDLKKLKQLREAAERPPVAGPVEGATAPPIVEPVAEATAPPIVEPVAETIAPRPLPPKEKEEADEPAKSKFQGGIIPTTSEVIEENMEEVKQRNAEEWQKQQEKEQFNLIRQHAWELAWIYEQNLARALSKEWDGESNQQKEFQEGIIQELERIMRQESFTLRMPLHDIVKEKHRRKMHERSIERRPGIIKKVRPKIPGKLEKKGGRVLNK